MNDYKPPDLAEALLISQRRLELELCCIAWVHPRELSKKLANWKPELSKPACMFWEAFQKINFDNLSAEDAEAAITLMALQLGILDTVWDPWAAAFPQTYEETAKRIFDDLYWLCAARAGLKIALRIVNDDLEKFYVYG